MGYIFDKESVKVKLSESEYDHFIGELYRNEDSIIRELDRIGGYETPLAIEDRMVAQL